MIKQLLLAVGLLFALACGGEAEEVEFETTEQDVTYIPFYGFRNDLADSNTRCLNAHSVSTHSCNIPPNRTITVRVTGTGMSASQKTQTESWVDGWAAGVSGDASGWTFSRTTSTTADVHISQGTLSGSNTNSIHTYARATVSGASAPLEDFGSPGVYKTYGSINCTIDRTKIFQHFASPQADRVWNHAVLYCANKGAGLGSGGSFVNGMNAIVVTTGSFKSICFTPYEKCALETYDPNATPGQIFPVCGSEFIPCPCAGKADNTCA